MHALLLAVTLLTPLRPQAAPTLQFTAERTNIATSQVAHVYVHNDSDELAHDVVVTVAASPGLQFYGELSASAVEWQCASESEQRASCRTDTLAPHQLVSLSFAFLGTSGTGGNLSATATLTARDVLPIEPIVFNVLATARFVVTTDSDFGAGTLRGAIDGVNANPLCGTSVPCVISFFGQMTIRPEIPLPPIRKCNVEIVGPDDPEFPFTVKRVAISGERATYGNGLEIRASCAEGVPGVKISSLAVHSWPWNGIYFEAPEAHRSDFGHGLNRVHVGTDETGLIAKPNGSRGVVTDSPHEIIGIANSIISGNGRSGVACFRGTSASVLYSRIGVNRDDQPLGNGAAGVFSNGVPFRVIDCTIAHNQTGVSIAKGTTKAAIADSKIYWNEGLPIDWGLDARTPNDDESDAIPNAPRILEAFYNEFSNTITVRGAVYLRAEAFTGTFGIDLYAARSERGDIEEKIVLPPQRVAPVAGGGEVPFEITFATPLSLRGRFLAAQTHALGPQSQAIVSSEISEAVIVR